MAAGVSIINNWDYKGPKPDFDRQEFLTIADMAAFREDYLPDFYRCYCKEDGNEYKYKRSNDVDPVTGKWRVATEGGMSDLPTASAAVKGGVKIGENLTMTGEVLSADKQTEEDFTTELKEKLEGIDMSTKVDVEEGKGLSTNDFTDELKAQYDKAEENVQSDWKEEDDTLDSFIKGKPTKLSDFENDPEFITKAVENLENYYKKSETYTQAEINALLQAINQFNVYLVDVLPELDIDDHAIYFCKKEGAVSDFYEQYIYVQNVWRKIGDTQISLDDYYTKTEADDLLDKKADQETTYTKTETDELLDDKQDVLEFDDEPTEGSDNPVTSTGVKVYVDTEVGKKLDKSFGEENKNKTLKTDENGDVVLIDVSSLPEPESKDKMFLSAENAETSELEWVQVDKGTIDGSAYVNLDIGSDFNTLVTHGRYRTTTKRVDRIENLPVQVAGMLTVRLTGSVIYQTYNSIDNKMYTRTSEDAGENWSDWKDVSEGGDEPFKGTHDEWDALTDEQKAQYETVIFTDDTSSGLIDDTKISRNSTWSSEEINANLGEKADYKLVVEDNNRYVEDIVTQDINTWLPNDNSSMLVNLMRKESSKYANFQLLCNKQDSINWSCIVSGAIGTLWKIRCVNGVRYVDELATMDKVASSKNRIAEKIVTMDSLDDTRTGMSIDFDADRGEIRLYVEKNGVTQKIVTFKSV